MPLSAGFLIVIVVVLTGCAFSVRQLQGLLMHRMKHRICKVERLPAAGLRTGEEASALCGLPGSSSEYATDLNTVRLSPIKKRPVYLSACILVRNEEAYLLEWIIYHYLLGFEHFYVYDNNSTDSTRESIAHMQELGLVTLIEWQHFQNFRFALEEQISDCWRRAEADKSKWVLNFDSDEFLVTFPTAFDPAPFNGSLKFVLHRHLETAAGSKGAAIILDRVEYGSNGHLQYEKGLQMEKFTMRSVPQWPRLIGKPLMLLEQTERQTSGHDAVVKSGWKVVDALNANVSGNEDRPVLEPLRLNHYYARSYEECMFKTTSEYKPGSSWRVEVGSQLCDSAYENSGYFDWDTHVQDTCLCNSVFPCFVKSLMVDFGQH
jgi:hypothetical protein